MSKLRRHIAFIILLATSMTLAAQQGLLHVQVLDSLDGTGIRDVSVMDRAGLPLGITDGEGSCVVQRADGLVPLVLSHVSYGKRDVSVSGEQQDVVVRWARASVLLPAAEVALPHPEAVFHHEVLDVAEFEITAHGIWVLAYGQPRMFRRQADAGRSIYRDVVLYLLDTAFAVEAWMPVVGDVYALHRSFGDKVFLETPDAAYQCSFDGRNIHLAGLSVEALRNDVLPWTDSIPGWLIGNNSTGDYPAFDHIAFDPEHASARVICSVQDDFTMELFRSQYKYMNGHDKVIAMDLALRTGIDKQVIAGYMTGFPKDIYFHAPYAPLFAVGDTLCVFDHYCGAIRKFDRAFSPVAETRIDYHRHNLWKGKLEQDAVTGTIFLLERNGPLMNVRRVDTASGRTGRDRILEHRFPEQVAVHDGYAYYVYRPFGGEQTRWLYRERLR